MTVEHVGTSAASERFRLLVIIASVREARFGPVVAHWFARRAGEHSRFADALRTARATAAYPA
jgi:hypothetical protein